MTQVKFYRVAQLPTSFSDSDKGTIYFVPGEGIYIYNGTELETYTTDGVVYPVVHQTNAGTSANDCVTIQPNVYNIWENGIVPKYIQLEPANLQVMCEYVLRFTIPVTVINHGLVFLNELKWANNDVPTWDAGCTYEISIIDGYATFLKYSL